MNFKKTAYRAVPLLAVVSLTVGTLATAGPVAPRGATSTGIKRAPATVKPAVTTTELFSGGATLPALAYEGTAALGGNPVTSSTTGSIFNYYTTKIAPSGTTISYCQTGSGFGKKVLDGVNAASGKDADLPCAALNTSPVTGTNGFGATGQSVADFSGSDAPFSSSEYSSFATNGATGSGNPIAGRKEPVQIPVLAGSVALLYNNSDSKVSGLKNLPLDDKSLCQMAAGKITTWPALRTQLITDGVLPSTTPAWASKNLYFISRYDGSGTSFSFTNHLAAVCPALGVSTFGVNQSYSSIIPQASAPSTFVAASGNPGVVTCITTGKAYGTTGGSCSTYGATTQTGTTIPNSGDGAIGYVEAGNAKAARSGTTGGPKQFATLGSTSTNQKNPLNDLPAAANTLTTSSLLVNDVVNQNTSGGPPSPFVSAQTPAVAGTSCLVIVDPSKYANPSSGYPIIAVTNLEFSYAGNLGKQSLEKGLAATFFSSANFGTGKITSVDQYTTTTGATGFSTVNLGGTTVTTAENCIGT